MIREAEKLPYEAALNLMRRDGKPMPTALQETAFRDLGYWSGAREFIVGRTSSGKTAIPVTAFRYARECGKPGCRLLYLVPIRTLAAQKLQEFRTLFPELEILQSTSEYCSSDEDVCNGRCDIALVIYEKAFLFQAKDPRFLGRYSHVVFDEAGTLESGERGVKVDYLLNRACRGCPDGNIYVLGTPFYDWSAYTACYGFHRIENEQRPVPIIERPICFTETDGYNKPTTKRIIIDICLKHLEQRHKVLIFANSKNGVMKLAKELAEDHKLIMALNSLQPAGSETSEPTSDAAQFDEMALLSADYNKIFDSVVRRAYRNGITFHHAGLPDELRERIEEDFLDRDALRIVCATETMAYGINSNVNAVIVAMMNKIDNGKYRFLTPNELYNYEGRAGRCGRCREGWAYLLLNGDKEKQYWESLNQTERTRLTGTPDRLPQRADQMLQALHFFDAGAQSMEQLAAQLHSFPITAPHEQLMEAVRISIDELGKRGLLCEEDDPLADEPVFRLTDRGHAILGYIVETDSFDELVRTAEHIEHKSIHSADLIWMLLSCREINSCTDHLQREGKKEKWLGRTPAQRAERKCGEALAFLDFLREKGSITEKLYQRIKCEGSHTFGVFGSDNLNKRTKDFFHKPQDTDWDILERLLLLEALSKWINAETADNIFISTGYNYADLARIGNKIKYLLDVLISGFSDKAQLDEESRDAYDILGVSFFYGIPAADLDHMRRCGLFAEVKEIEPLKGRQLRALVQTVRLYERREQFEPDEKKYEKADVRFREAYRHCEKRFPKELLEYLDQKCGGISNGKTA